MNGDRILDLEIKNAYLERHLMELDSVVRDLARDLRRLQEEVGLLRGAALGDTGTGVDGERPPHYDFQRIP
jgi:uncharacterized coiled-coil protein SlyX